ncbi:MAG: cytochrome c oxidase assembly protein [Betaproteobacteria bacterium]|nr:MAG: cytochrome c oxidase assembly protein [Betaproteobacteria bacterium]
MSNSINKRNRETFRKLTVITLVMFGFGYALVPLYEKICEVTGINDLAKPDEVVNAQVDTSRSIVLEFDANVRGEIAWELVPRERKRKVHPGELVHVVFDLKNSSEVPVLAQAIPSYGPQRAGLYVKKLDCFCFTQQEIAAGENLELPVVLVVEPSIPRDVHTVTLSYTMFEIEGGGERTAAKELEGGKG